MNTRTCPRGKQMHSTREEAQEQLVSFKTRSKSRSKNGGRRVKPNPQSGHRTLQVYRCLECDHWHIGHARP